LRHYRPFHFKNTVNTFEDKLESFRGRRVLVVGLGRSGIGAAKVMAPVAAVTACDGKSLTELDAEARKLAEWGVELRAGDQDAALLEGKDLVVRSPGVPWNAPLVAAARERGVEVIGELELAYRLLATDRLVAVTGSNGKSTTTAWIGDILRQGGQKVFVAGNIGLALTNLLPAIDADSIVVAEVSSFQLEDADELRPRVAVLLNLAPDHIDRHGSLEEYYRMKWRLFRRQQADDVAVLNADDPNVAAGAKGLTSKVLWFGGRGERDGVNVQGCEIRYRVNGNEGVLLDVEEVSLPGPHNLANAMAAATAALAIGADPAAVATGLGSFRGLPHRLEPAGEVGGVRYVNDSKATNVASAVVALASFDAPVVLIAGGKAKGESFEPLARAAAVREVRRAVLYGAAAEALAAAFEGKVPYERVRTVVEAVLAATRAAQPGDVVLLAPACTSWDQYRNFEERGDDFKREVSRLAEREAS
jgi:UDP-N-acetylmuramoylalanine--D-glutamate ligase